MRTAVAVIDLVLGVAAVIVGAILAVRGRRLAAAWLPNGPFKSLLWPGLALLVLSGGSLLGAAGLVLSADVHTGRLVSVEAGVVLAAWGAVMMSLAGYRRWQLLLPFVLGVAVVVLSFGLPVPG